MRHMRRNLEGISFLSVGLGLAMVAVSACSSSPTDTAALTALCRELLAGASVGANRDGIPSLTDPDLVAADDVLAGYLLPTDRVIGIKAGSDYLAFPHNILWWHEIVNMRSLGLAITYCPLTGSSMVFSNAAAAGAEFGVSGLLFENNLVMFDRSAGGSEEDESLWPQMLAGVAGARCGPAEGLSLTMYRSIEIEWADWVALHPDTRVVSPNTGSNRDYRVYPYGGYELEGNPRTLMPLPSLDDRRPPKERVLGIPLGKGGGTVFPFGALRDLGDLAVVHESVGGTGAENAVVVFWDSDAATAVAFRPRVGVQDLTFEVTNGAFVDAETGSQWSIDGEALSGPLVGSTLPIVTDAYVSFWFAFARFFPNLDLWLP